MIKRRYANSILAAMLIFAFLCQQAAWAWSEHSALRPVAAGDRNQGAGGAGARSDPKGAALTAQFQKFKKLRLSRGPRKKGEKAWEEVEFQVLQALSNDARFNAILSRYGRGQLAEYLTANVLRAPDEMLEAWYEMGVIRESFLPRDPNALGPILADLLWNTLERLPAEIPRGHPSIQEILKQRYPIKRLLYLEFNYRYFKEKLGLEGRAFEGLKEALLSIASDISDESALYYTERIVELLDKAIPDISRERFDIQREYLKTVKATKRGEAKIQIFGRFLDLLTQKGILFPDLSDSEKQEFLIAAARLVLSGREESSQVLENLESTYAVYEAAVLGRELVNKGQVVFSAAAKGNYDTGTAWIFAIPILGPERTGVKTDSPLVFHQRIQFGIPPATLKKAKLKFGDQVAIRVEKDLNHGQILVMYRGGAAKGGDFRHPIAAYRFFHEITRNYPTGSVLGHTMIVDLKKLDIVSYYFGNRKIQPRQGDPVMLPIHRKEDRKRKVANSRVDFKHPYRQKEKKVIFQLGPIAEMLYQKGLLPRKAAVDIKEDPDYGAHIEVSTLVREGPKILVRYYLIEGSDNETRPVDFERWALSDWVSGNQNIHGQPVMPRPYTYLRNPSAQPGKLYWMGLGYRGKSGGKVNFPPSLREKNIHFEPVRDPGRGWLIHLHDFEAYKKDPSRKPEAVYVRNQHFRMLVPIKGASYYETAAFLELGRVQEALELAGSRPKRVLPEGQAAGEEQAVAKGAGIEIKDYDMDLGLIDTFMQMGPGKLLQAQISILFNALHVRNLTDAKREILRDFLVEIHISLIGEALEALGIDRASSIDGAAASGYALEGLIEAVEDYDPAQETVFSDYARQRIRMRVSQGMGLGDLIPHRRPAKMRHEWKKEAGRRGLKRDWRSTRLRSSAKKLEKALLIELEKLWNEKAPEFSKPVPFDWWKTLTPMVLSGLYRLKADSLRDLSGPLGLTEPLCRHIQRRAQTSVLLPPEFVAGIFNLIKEYQESNLSPYTLRFLAARAIPLSVIFKAAEELGLPLSSVLAFLRQHRGAHLFAIEYFTREYKHLREKYSADLRKGRLRPRQIAGILCRNPDNPDAVIDRLSISRPGGRIGGGATAVSPARAFRARYPAGNREVLGHI